jgi:hypothetical protein
MSVSYPLSFFQHSSVVNNYYFSPRNYSQAYCIIPALLPFGRSA